MTQPAWGWTSAEDLRAEQRMAREVEAAWPGTIVGSFPRVTVLDWWMARSGAMVAVAEVKRRRVASDTYPTVYLSVSKYLALTHAALAFGVIPLYLVGFEDGVRWVDLRQWAPDRPTLAGRKDRTNPNDWEPMLEVPLSTMAPLTDSP